MLADKLRTSTGARELPQFISSSAGYSSLGAPVVATPPEIRLNDLITVIISCQTSSNTIETIPVGFIQKSNSLGTGMGFYVATKIATVSEPSSYTFTTANTADRVTAMVFIFRNATNINTIGNVTKAFSSNQTASSITPSYGGVLIAAFGTSINAAVTTPPSSMTLIQTSSQEQNTASVYYQSNNSKVATPSKNITFGAGSNGYGIQFQITNEPTASPEFVSSSKTQNPATGTTLVINKPPGTTEGDLMVSVVLSSVSNSWTGDTSWVEVADEVAAPAIRVAYKLASSSEPISYTFTASGPGVLAGAILTYRYANYDTIGSFVSASTLLIPTITCTESQSILIAIGGTSANNVTQIPPIGATTRVLDNDAVAPSFSISDQVVAKGPTGTRLIGRGADNGSAGAIMLSIKPTRSI